MYEDKLIQIPEVFKKGATVTEGFFPALFFDVLQGKRAIYVAKHVIPVSDCQKIVSTFFQSKHRTKYSVHPLIERIGEPLYFAEPERVKKYFSSSEEMNAYIQEIYKIAGCVNYTEHVFSILKDFYQEKGHDMRVIQHNQEKGFYGILRSWGKNGDTLAKESTPIHEDRIQLRLHNNLETQKLIRTNLASSCFYFSNGKQGGELTVYDVRLPVGHYIYEKQGDGEYGFSEEFVEGAERITVTPEAGDVITFWADRLHKVGGIEGGNRVTAAFFSGINPETKDCLVWS